MIGNSLIFFRQISQETKGEFSRGYDREEQNHKFNLLKQTGRVDFNLQYNEFPNEYFPDEMKLHQYLEN